MQTTFTRLLLIAMWSFSATETVAAHVSRPNFVTPGERFATDRGAYVLHRYHHAPRYHHVPHFGHRRSHGHHFVPRLPGQGRNALRERHYGYYDRHYRARPHPGGLSLFFLYHD